MSLVQKLNIFLEIKIKLWLEIHFKKVQLKVFKNVGVKPSLMLKKHKTCIDFVNLKINT